MPDTKRPLRVFLCHASGDKPAVTKLYGQLVKDGIDAWLDKEKLIAGQDWQVEIPKAVKNSDVVIVCLSSQSVSKEGFVQKEIKIALDAADEKPDGTIFIIPTRLENCEVPERIGRFHWVDLFSDDGYERLTRALHLRANNLGIIFKRKRKFVKQIIEDGSSNTNSVQGDTLNNIEQPQGNTLEASPQTQDNFQEVGKSQNPSSSEVTEFERQKSFFIFFADEKKANSISKLMLFNDVGRLKIEKNLLNFNGMFSNFNLSSINQISITRQVFPWIGFMLSNIFNILFLIAFYVFLYYSNGQDPILLSTGFIAGFIVLFSILLVISNVMGVGIFLIQKWARIEYKDENGQYHSIYVADARFLGYSGLFGGTEKIYNVLLAQKNYFSKYRAYR